MHGVDVACDNRILRLRHEAQDIAAQHTRGEGCEAQRWCNQMVQPDWRGRQAAVTPIMLGRQGQAASRRQDQAAAAAPDGIVANSALLRWVAA